MSYTDDEKQLIAGLLEKLEGEEAPGTAYIFDNDEVQMLKEMMTSYRDVRTVVKFGARAGKLLIFLAALYGSWVALREGLFK